MRWTNKDIEVIPNGNQLKTLKLVDKYAEREKNHPFITSSIQKYNLGRSVSDLQKIFEAIHRIIIFEPDPENIQLVRTVNRTLKDQRGNCVDYTVFFSAFLRALKIPHLIRIVEYPNQARPGYSHIYPKTLEGVTLDAVIGQEQTGNEFKKLNRIPYFNVEVMPYKSKIDKIVKP